ncbi:hypothetical protein DEO72_LG5g406 [Vigna unguiculata]|uniref:Uncharacterized protein n=1 Tax=Vigna unguiculata TaxID=3917 RepID=A0A4D6LWT3_VIGUN|nr:hypothetical protein DEO72_LG5g406 [Vigna unguiculata]
MIYSPRRRRVRPPRATVCDSTASGSKEENNHCGAAEEHEWKPNPLISLESLTSKNTLTSGSQEFEAVPIQLSDLENQFQ